MPPLRPPEHFLNLVKGRDFLVHETDSESVPFMLKHGILGPSTHARLNEERRRQGLPTVPRKEKTGPISSHFYSRDALLLLPLVLFAKKPTLKRLSSLSKLCSGLSPAGPSETRALNWRSLALKFAEIATNAGRNSQQSHLEKARAVLRQWNVRFGSVFVRPGEINPRFFRARAPFLLTERFSTFLTRFDKSIERADAIAISRLSNALVQGRDLSSFYSVKYGKAGHPRWLKQLLDPRLPEEPLRSAHYRATNPVYAVCERPSDFDFFPGPASKRSRRESDSFYEAWNRTEDLVFGRLPPEKIIALMTHSRNPDLSEIMEAAVKRGIPVFDLRGRPLRK